MPVSPARGVAYRVLRAVDAGRADLPSALERGRARLPDDRDRGLAAEIVIGTLRWRGALDHVIEYYSGRALARLDPEIADVLRMGAYQLLYLNRVPAAVAVDEAVTLARQSRKRSAAGLVNAVLRAIAKDRDRPPLPPRPTSLSEQDGRPLGAADQEAALDYLSITLSHPRWLAKRWLERYSFAGAEAWARFNNSPAPVTLRANTLRASAEALVEELAGRGVDVRRTDRAPDGLVVTGGNVFRTGLVGSGRLLVQDEASQLVALMVGARPGTTVLDACASPGGKTVALAGEMNNRGLLVAGDTRPRRVELLRRTLTVSGATCARIVRLDLRDQAPFRAVFDRVFVDAPCSGLGTIRRDPEIRWRRREEDLGSFAGEQRRMLAGAAGAVAPGGWLVYATCSSEPEENEEIVDHFLAGHPEFGGLGLREAADMLPPCLHGLVGEDFCLRTEPGHHGLEAFFASVLRRAR
jgi:16S rRNA (cytosine967-C5)-methyltransferase